MATFFFYLLLLLVQTANADAACEGYPRTVPGAGFEDVRGIEFENSYLNLGGACAYRMNDGSVVHTREPGWWLSGTVASFAAALAGGVAFAVRRKGHRGLLFGLTTLVAPPLGVLLAVAVPRRVAV